MKLLALFFTVGFFIINGNVFATDISDKEVISLVTATCGDIQKAANPEKDVLQKVIAGEHPYKNKDKKSLYVFIYNEDVEIVAHHKKSLVGRSYKGKPDVKGKKFRDLIVSNAIANKTGWETYYYQKPGETGIFLKKAYYQFCNKDDKKFIVVAGKYAEKLGKKK